MDEMKYGNCMDTVMLQSQSVEIAETLANGNIRAKFVICDFGVNKNNLQINKDTIINWYQSIVNQPLVGRVKNGDFTGHNLKLIPYIDEAGEVQKKVELDTDAFGTFVSSGIEKVNGVECLVATAEIWSRFTRAFNVVKTRIENGTLYSSFEIRVNDYRVADGVKIVDDAFFTAHCCLGKNVAPAYDSSRLLEVAEYDESILQALAEDIAEQNKKMGDETVENEKIDEILLAEDENEDPAAGETPDSDVPSGDAGDGGNTGTEPETNPETEPGAGEGGNDDGGNTDAGNGDSDPSAGGSNGGEGGEGGEGGGNNTPEVDPKTLDDESDDGAGNGTGAPVGAPAKKADTVADNEGVNVSEVETLRAEVAQRDAALATANDTINSLKAEIAALFIYKEQIEKAEAERMEAEKAIRRDALKAYALNSKLISAEELETSEEIKNMISSVDEDGIKRVIGQRFMESLENKKPVETASAESVSVMKTIVDDDGYSGSIVNAYIHKK